MPALHHAIFYRLVCLFETLKTNSTGNGMIKKLIIRPYRRSLVKAAYSHRTFPPTVCWSVCLSVCPVDCGKTGDWIWIRFGMVGRMGPGMRQVVGFRDRSMGGGNFGYECGCPIATNGKFVC